MAKTSAEYQRERRSKGLCSSCSKQAVPGKATCEACAAKARARYYATYKPKRAANDVDRSTYDQNRYNSRKAAGLCPLCGDTAATGLSVYCLSCLTKQRQRQQKRAAAKATATAKAHQQRANTDCCLDCGLPAADVFRDQRCRLCWSRWMFRTDQLTFHAAHKAAGLCQSCNGHVATDETQCPACLEKRRQKSLADQQAGLCRSCGQPRDTTAGKCTGCRERQRRLTQQRREAGQCTSCGAATKPDGALCQACLDQYGRRGKKRRQRLRDQILSAYGNACTCCGETRPQFLHVDHVYNDGAAHRKRDKLHSGYAFYIWLRKHDFPKDRFQILCANCNLAKAKYGICPHELERQALSSGDQQCPK